MKLEWVGTTCITSSSLDFHICYCSSSWSYKKRRISKVWKRGQMVINEWKQLLSYKKSNEIFSIFESSKLAKKIINEPFVYMPDYINKLSFKSFGIEYEHLVIKFIAKGLLPKNFFDLK